LSEGIDSSIATVASVAATDDVPSFQMAEVPPLAWMAGLAGLADLLINRVLIRLGHSTWSNEALLRLDQWGSFARNLSVVAALVATAFCLGALSSKRSGLPLSARAGISAFGWVLVPIVTLMTFLPLAWTRPELVLVVAGLAHATMLLLILAGLQWKSTPGTIAALILTFVASVSGVAAMIVSVVGGQSYWTHTDRLSNAFQWSGELAYLATPVAVAFALAIPWGTARGKAAVIASAMAAAVVAVGMAVWYRAVGNDLPTMIYGAGHLDLFPDKYAVLYAIPLGIGWAVTVAATMSKDPERRQLGAALLLLLSAGYAPRSPSTLILTVLGVALLARSAIALAQGRR
jgi:hypothetical protein